MDTIFINPSSYFLHLHDGLHILFIIYTHYGEICFILYQCEYANSCMTLIS